MKRERQNAKPTERHRSVAKQYLSGDATLADTLEANGFARCYANGGVPELRARSTPFRRAFDAEVKAKLKQVEELDFDAPIMEKLVQWRLATNVAGGKDEGVHSARALGSLKKLDLFVRNNDIQVGLFASFADPNSRESATLDQLVATLHLCGWCRESHNTFDELAMPMPNCPKNPANEAETLTVQTNVSDSV
jgi:hypothetical protein